MRLSILLLPVAAGCLSILLAAPNGLMAGRLLRTGCYHCDEVSARNGQPWLALLPRGPHGHELRAIGLRIEPYEDPFGGSTPDGGPDGKKVSIPHHPEADFLFKDIPGLQPGPVAWIPGRHELRPNKPLTLALISGNPYTLELVCPPFTNPSGDGRVAATLVYRKGNTRQVLGTFEAIFEHGRFVCLGSDGNLELLWAGDLNRDGAPDLIIDLSDHYNMSLPTLFLSAPKASGHLVTRVAQFKAVGC